MSPMEPCNVAVVSSYKHHARIQITGMSALFNQQLVTCKFQVDQNNKSGAYINEIVHCNTRFSSRSSQTSGRSACSTPRRDQAQGGE